MVRNLLGSLLALIGAAAAAWSPFRDWYAGRAGRDVPIKDLFTSAGVSGATTTLWTSLFLPLLVAGVLTLIAVVLRSRLLVVLAALIVLGFAALWMVRQGQTVGSLTAGGDGLQEGAAFAVGGALVMLLGALVMQGRHGPRRRGSHARVEGYDPHERDEGFERPQRHEHYGDGGDGGDGPEPGSHGASGPHGAYLADEGHGRPLGASDTPHEEWDPWQPPPESRRSPSLSRLRGRPAPRSRGPAGGNRGHRSTPAPTGVTPSSTRTTPGGCGDRARTTTPPSSRPGPVSRANGPRPDGPVSSAGTGPCPSPRPARRRSGPCCTRTPRRRRPPASR